MYANTVICSINTFMYLRNVMYSFCIVEYVNVYSIRMNCLIHKFKLGSIEYISY